MADAPPRPLEELLLSFVHSTDESESEQALDALFATGVRPMVASVLRRKFRTSLSKEDLTTRNLDALELASDIDLKLLKVFRHLREDPNGTPIANPGAYVQTIINNAFRQHLRDRYPQRVRLRNKIKYITRNSREFASWTGPDGRLVCGRREWANRKITSELGSVNAPAMTPGESASLDDNRRIIALVRALFVAAGAPMFVSDVVNAIAGLLGLKDGGEVDLEESVLGHNDRSLEVQITERISLQRFWEEIAALPLRHRTALLLNLRGEQGENILAFLPMLRIASLRTIAAALEIPAEELASLWNQLPLNDNTIAERLDITRQQVINLRQSARAKLGRKRI